MITLQLHRFLCSRYFNGRDFHTSAYARRVVEPCLESATGISQDTGNVDVEILEAKDKKAEEGGGVTLYLSAPHRFPAYRSCSANSNRLVGMAKRLLRVTERPCKPAALTGVFALAGTAD